MSSRRHGREYHGTVNTVFHLDEVRQPVWTRRLMLGAWILILAKCAAVWWVIDHWHVPVHPAWIIAPTLAMAALATFLWATHAED